MNYMARIAVVLMIWGGVNLASVAEEIPTRLPAVPRIVAIGDVHGDLSATRRALKLSGAIDDTDHWIGGDLVVVQTGDQLDRGDEEQAILDLFASLAEEASAAGGGVYSLNGNHEVLNVAIDFRYVTEGGFADFQDAVVVNEADTTLTKYEKSPRARIVSFRPGGKYARNLAKRNVVMVIGENVFVHGGIMSHHIEYGLAKINSECREWMLGNTPKPGSLRGSDSLIWTRHYSDDVDEEDCLRLLDVLSQLGAKRMIVGHTVQKDGIVSYCDGLVWCIDTGMSAHYGGEPEVLEIMGDKLTILREK